MVPALTLYMDDIQKNLDVAESLGFNTHLVIPGDEVGDYLRQQGFY